MTTRPPEDINADLERIDQELGALPIGADPDVVAAVYDRESALWKELAAHAVDTPFLGAVCAAQIAAHGRARDWRARSAR